VVIDYYFIEKEGLLFLVKEGLKYSAEYFLHILSVVQLHTDNTQVFCFGLFRDNIFLRNDEKEGASAACFCPPGKGLRIRRKTIFNPNNMLIS